MVIWNVFGRTIISIAGTLLLATGLFFLLGRGLGQYGAARSSNREEIFYREDRGRNRYGDRPTLYVESVRILQGENRRLGELVYARDVDGNRLDKNVRCTDEKGNVFPNRLNTLLPGCYPVTFSVRSAITGKKTQKTVLILVDGRA